MKKNIFGFIVSMLLVLALCFAIVACTDENEPENNNPPTTSSSNTESGDVNDEDEKLPQGPFDASDTSKITIDYKTMTYVGTSLKDFSPIFDEQDFMLRLEYLYVPSFIFIPLSVHQVHDAHFKYFFYMVVVKAVKHVFSDFSRLYKAVEL